MDLIMHLSASTRSAKDSLGLLKNDRPDMIVVPFGADAPALADKLSDYCLELATLSVVSGTRIERDLNHPSLAKCMPVMADDRLKVFLALTENVDVPTLVK